MCTADIILVFYHIFPFYVLYFYGALKIRKDPLFYTPLLEKLSDFSPAFCRAFL